MLPEVLLFAELFLDVFDVVSVSVLTPHTHAHTVSQQFSGSSVLINELTVEVVHFRCRRRFCAAGLHYQQKGTLQTLWRGGCPILGSGV